MDYRSGESNKHQFENRFSYCQATQIDKCEMVLRFSVATVASLTKEQCFGSLIWRADFVKSLGFFCLPGLGSNFVVGLSSMHPPLTHSFYLGAYCGGSQLMLHPERRREVQMCFFPFF